MNPYVERMVGYLAGQDPLGVLQNTPAELAALWPRLNPQHSYAEGKWNAGQILAHLVDVELGLGFRLRQILSQPNHTIQPFDQEAWMQLNQPQPALHMGVFAALRALNLGLWQTLGPTHLQRTYTHPERGPESVGLLLQVWAGHDLNHLQQLRLIVGKPA